MDNYKKLQFEIDQTITISRAEYAMLKGAYKKYEANNSKSDEIKYLKKSLNLMKTNHQKEIDDLNKDIDDLKQTGYKATELAIIKDLLFTLSFGHDIMDIFPTILIAHGYITDDDFKMALEELSFIDERFINLLKHQGKNTDKMADIQLDPYNHIRKLEQFIEKISNNEEVKFKYTVYDNYSKDKNDNPKKTILFCKNDSELRKKLNINKTTNLYINMNVENKRFNVKKEAML